MVVTSFFVFLIKHSPNFCVAKKIHLSILLAVFNGSCAQSVPAHTRWNGAYDQNVYFASKQTNEKRVLANHNTPLPVYVGTNYFDLKNQHNWQPYHYQISNKTTGKKHQSLLKAKEEDIHQGKRQQQNHQEEMIETNHTTIQFIEPEHKDIQVAEHTQSGQVPWLHTDKTQLRNQENKSQKITKQFTTKLRTAQDNQPKVTIKDTGNNKKSRHRVSNHMGRQTHSHRGQNPQTLVPKHQGATSPKEKSIVQQIYRKISKNCQ